VTPALDEKANVWDLEAKADRSELLEALQVSLSLASSWQRCWIRV